MFPNDVSPDYFLSLDKDTFSYFLELAFMVLVNHDFSVLVQILAVGIDLVVKSARFF